MRTVITFLVRRRYEITFTPDTAVIVSEKRTSIHLRHPPYIRYYTDNLRQKPHNACNRIRSPAMRRIFFQVARQSIDKP